VEATAAAGLGAVGKSAFVRSALRELVAPALSTQRGVTYRATGNVWQLADMRSLCEPKIGVRVAFAKLARVIFATRILALYVRRCDFFFSYIQAPLPKITGLMYGICQSLPVFCTLPIFTVCQTLPVVRYTDS
jgi:hypothetical protein